MTARNARTETDTRNAAAQPKHTPGSCRHCGKEDIGLGHACEGMMGDPFREGRAQGNEQKLAADNAALRQQVAELREALEQYREALRKTRGCIGYKEAEADLWFEWLESADRNAAKVQS